ncbi:MAG: nitroreductase family protein [Anaerolineae bacterium]|jgi:nitroreductase|nr:nitroreductase family protein [Anaerolineae bacterium]
MDFYDVLRTAGTARYYKEDPIPDDVLTRVLDAARWAPQGGNRQPNRYVVVRDPAKKQALRDLYFPVWREYLAKAGVGEIAIKGNLIPKLLQDADYFADNFHKVPAIVVVCAHMPDIHPTDLELERDPIVYGASVYPAVQNLLLAARYEGLGGSLTTLLCAEEPAVKAMLNIPDPYATAAHLALGYLSKPFPSKLTRMPLTEVVFSEEFGAPLYPHAE